MASYELSVIDVKRRLLYPSLLSYHVPGLPNRRLGWGLAPFCEATPPRDGPWHDHLHEGGGPSRLSLLRDVARDLPKSPRSAMTRCPGHLVSPRVVCAALFVCWLVVPHKGHAASSARDLRNHALGGGGVYRITKGLKFC